MFSSLASYLFGETADETKYYCENEDKQVCRLHTKPNPDDSEWILVDASRGNSPHRAEMKPLEDLLVGPSSTSVCGSRALPSSAASDTSIVNHDITHPPAGHKSPHRKRALASRIGLVPHVQSSAKQASPFSCSLTRNRMRRVNTVNGKMIARSNNLKFHIHQPAARCTQKRC